MKPSDENPYTSPALISEPSKDGPVLFSQGLLATRWQRFAAAFIDSLIASPIGFVLGMAIGGGLVVAGIIPQSIAFRVTSSLVGVLIGCAVFVALHGYLLITRGQTIGKYLLKTQIVSNDGDLIPLGRLICTRYLPMWLLYLVPAIGPGFALVNVLAIFREERKCLHDEIAGTKVIQLD